MRQMAIFFRNGVFAVTAVAVAAGLLWPFSRPALAGASSSVTGAKQLSVSALNVSPAPCSGSCMTGLWHLDYTGGAPSAYCSSSISEDDTGALSGTSSCTDASPGTFVGTHDRSTGAVSLTETFAVVGGDWVVSAEGQASSDGQALSGTFQCTAGCVGQGTFSGYQVLATVGSSMTTTQEGNLVDASGDTLTVPVGALPQDMIVTLDLVPLPLAPPSGMQAIRSAFTFGPSGTVFNSPVTVVFNYTAGDLPYGADPSTLQVALFDSQSSSWTFVGGVVDTVNRTVTVQLAHFSTYGLFLTTPQIPTSTPNPTPAVLIPSGAVGGITDVRVVHDSGTDQTAQTAVALGVALVALVVAGCGVYYIRQRSAFR